MKPLKAVESGAETKQETCPAHGLFTARRVDDWMGWTDCPKCLAEQQAAKRQAAVAREMERACIPARFASKGLDIYQAASQGQITALKAAQAYCRDFGKHRQDGICLIFAGKPGTGKTHLACAAITQVIAAGYTGRYTRAFELIEAIRATWRRDSRKTEREIIEEFTQVDLLVLDEVGVQYGSESETVELFKVLDTRYLDVKPSIVITNVGRDELQQYLGARAFDRLKENGGRLVLFDWDSFRH